MLHLPPDFSQFAPRVEAADILTDWADSASWRSRTSRTLRIVGIMAEHMVSTGYKNQAVIVLENY